VTLLNSTPAVGIVGVGNMGGAIARRLLQLGFSVHVHDIDPNKTMALEKLGAVIHSNPASLSEQARTVIVCVVDHTQVDQLLDPHANAPWWETLQAGHTVLLCPTLAPDYVESVASRLQAHGVFTIDAPMSGGPVRAEAGTMSLMVACEDAVFARQAKLLQALSDHVFRIGTRVGDGARTKLVNNLLAGINLVGAAEVMALSEHLGLSLDTTLSVIEQSSGQSWIGSERMRRALANDLAPRAHMTLLAKDTGLAVDAAKTAGFQGVLGPLAAQSFAQACQTGLAQADDAAMLQWIRQQQK
jgi:L-threonate 2-dehydrogenase